MKVKVKDLKPNPYRDMEKYPINLKRVKYEKSLIEKVGAQQRLKIIPHAFRARPINNDWNSNGYELFGCEEILTALKELKIKEVDIPIGISENKRMLMGCFNAGYDTPHIRQLLGMKPRGWISPYQEFGELMKVYFILEKPLRKKKLNILNKLIKLNPSLDYSKLYKLYKSK